MVGTQALGKLVGADLVGLGPVRGCEALAAPVAEVRLRRAQVIPVGLGLHAEAHDRDGLALDAEQVLDDALRFLVAPFAEVLVADDPLPVDEIERRPVVVVEGAPDPVVVVDRDGVVDLPLLHRPAHEIDLVLERELRRVGSDHDQPVVSVGLRPRADIRLLAQPVDAGERPEVHQDDAAAQPDGVERLGVEPLGRPVELRHVNLREQGHLAILFMTSCDQRNDLNAARISSEKSSGSSQAAKCPPLSTSLK